MCIRDIHPISSSYPVVWYAAILYLIISFFPAMQIVSTFDEASPGAVTQEVS